MTSTAKGVSASVTASVIFGFMYYYATLLRPLDGLDIFGWRILGTLPFLTLLMAATGQARLIVVTVHRMLFSWRLLPLACVSAGLLGVQFWLFMWAAINNRALNVSLGYLLMPLVMVLCGRLLYRERLALYQKIAVLCAALGVGNQLLRVGVSWEMLLVALGFPAYFILRRRLKTNHMGGLWLDMALMLPGAALALACSGLDFSETFAQRPALYLLIPLMGAISAVSVGGYMLAVKLLPLGLFGLLSYVEPVLLVGVSLLLGERIAPAERLTYVGVGLAVGFLALGGARHLARR